MQRQVHRQTGPETGTQADRRQTGAETGTQADRSRERYIGQTGRQTETYPACR